MCTLYSNINDGYMYNANVKMDVENSPVRIQNGHLDSDLNLNGNAFQKQKGKDFYDQCPKITGNQDAGYFCHNCQQHLKTPKCKEGHKMENHEPQNRDKFRCGFCFLTFNSLKAVKFHMDFYDNEYHPSNSEVHFEQQRLDSAPGFEESENVRNRVVLVYKNELTKQNKGLESADFCLGVKHKKNYSYTTIVTERPPKVVKEMKHTGNIADHAESDQEADDDDEGLYMCRHCRALYRSEQKYLNHLAEYHIEPEQLQKYSCPSCNKVLASQKLLNVHFHLYHEGSRHVSSRSSNHGPNRPLNQDQTKIGQYNDNRQADPSVFNNPNIPKEDYIEIWDGATVLVSVPYKTSKNKQDHNSNNEMFDGDNYGSDEYEEDGEAVDFESDSGDIVADNEQDFEKLKVLKVRFQGGKRLVHVVGHSSDFKQSRRILFDCLNCPRRYQSSLRLSMHMERHSKDRVFKCPYCPRAFSFSFNLRKHKFSHTRYRVRHRRQRQKTGFCHECAKTGIMDMKTHCLLHRQGHLMCQGCGRMFRSEAAARIHLKFECANQEYFGDLSGMEVQNYETVMDDEQLQYYFVYYE